MRPLNCVVPVLSLIATHESPLTPLRVTSTPSRFAAAGESLLVSEFDEEVTVVELFSPLERSPTPKIAKANTPAATPPSAFCKAAQALKERGAGAVYAYCTHAVLSGGAIERINSSELNELVVTDTIPLSEEGRACGKIRQLSCAALLGETILRISNAESVSSLFVD